MKKLLLLTTVFITGFALFGCQAIDDYLDNDKPLSTQEEVLGFSAISSVVALSDTQTPVAKTSNGITLLNSEEPTLDLLNDIEELEPYLPLINTFIGGTPSFSVEEKESDLEDYEVLLEIQMLNLNQEVETYSFYYNEEIISDSSEDDDDDDDKDQDVEDEDTDDEEEENEIESILSGIMIIGETTYTLEGERKMESEEDESEQVLNLVASLDDENYVTVEYTQETETDASETEFVYEHFVNNQMVKRTEFEFEDETGEKELSLKFLAGDTEMEFEFELENENGQRVIEVGFKKVVNGSVVDEGEMDIVITYNQETGEYSIAYEYEGETIKESDSNDDDDEDEDADVEDEDADVEDEDATVEDEDTTVEDEDAAVEDEDAAVEDEDTNTEEDTNTDENSENL